MKLFCILLTAILCASASAQTIKTLGFNSTNGQVVANTGVLTFTNSVNFGGDLLLSNNTFFFGTNARWSPEDNSFSTALAFDGTNVIADTRANLGFSTNLNTLWTATNASNARSAIGLGATNAVEFSNVSIGGSGQMYLQGAAGSISFYDGIDAEIVLQIPADTDPVVINGQWNDSSVRSNLGLPLAALTNTSNVTIIQALSGAAQAAYNGTVIFTNIQGIVVSNGIIVDIEE